MTLEYLLNTKKKKKKKNKKERWLIKRIKGKKKKKLQKLFSPHWSILVFFGLFNPIWSNSIHLIISNLFFLKKNYTVKKDKEKFPTKWSTLPRSKTLSFPPSSFFSPTREREWNEMEVKTLRQQNEISPLKNQSQLLLHFLNIDNEWVNHVHIFVHLHVNFCCSFIDFLFFIF